MFVCSYSQKSTSLGVVFFGVPEGIVNKEAPLASERTLLVRPGDLITEYREALPDLLAFRPRDCPVTAFLFPYPPPPLLISCPLAFNSSSLIFKH